MRSNIILISAIICSLLISCGVTGKCGANSITGHLKDLNGLDGCGFVIELDDSTILNPVNLNDLDIDLVDGAKVSLSFTKLEDAMGICMVGEMVEVKCIENK